MSKEKECRSMYQYLNKLIKKTNEEYLTVSMIEGKTHQNAYDRLEYYQQQKKKLLEQCKKYNLEE